MEISKNDLKKLSESRIEEARILLENKKYSGAYYIAGYSIELALKACIAGNFRADVLPDKDFLNNIYTHNFSTLISKAGLTAELEKEKSTPFYGNWSIVNNWTAEARYQAWDVINATALYNAITDTQYGVMQWLKKYY